MFFVILLSIWSILPYFHWCIPIIELELGRFRPPTSEKVILYYKDLPNNPSEIVFLNCKLPHANRYEWSVNAKMGAPYAGNVNLGLQGKASDRPWLMKISDDHFFGDAILVMCTAKTGTHNLITLAWVIMRLESNHALPFHPTICTLPGAQCVEGQYDCYNKKGRYYLGKVSVTAKGLKCRYWYEENFEKSHDKYAVFSTDLADHNYCRNNLSHTRPMNKPWCSTFNDNTLHECHVPKCSNCIIGDGRKSSTLSAYNGKTTTTKAITQVDGKRVFKTCYQGVSNFWLKNTCSSSANVKGRKGKAGTLQCLVLKDNAKISDNPHSNSFEFQDCTAPQCVNRQVWFALVNVDGYLHLLENNKNYIKIPLLLGRQTKIDFFAFGIVHAEDIRVKGDGSTIPYANSMRLVRKVTPYMSQLVIKNPNIHYKGKYSLVYKSKVGMAPLDVLEYRVNLQLVVRTPSRFTIDPVAICPGYTALGVVHLHGSYALTPGSMMWHLSRDNTTWYDVTQYKKYFRIKELVVRMSGIKESFSLRVSAESRSGRFETIRQISVLPLPKMEIKNTALEGQQGKSLEIRVLHHSNNEIEWSYKDEVISETNQHYEQSTIVDGSDAISILRILALTSHREGIYTVFVRDSRCTSQDNVYVSIKT